MLPWRRRLFSALKAIHFLCKVGDRLGKIIILELLYMRSLLDLFGQYLDRVFGQYSCSGEV